MIEYLLRRFEPSTIAGGFLAASAGFLGLVYTYDYFSEKHGEHFETEATLVKKKIGEMCGGRKSYSPFKPDAKFCSATFDIILQEDGGKPFEVLVNTRDEINSLTEKAKYCFALNDRAASYATSLVEASPAPCTGKLPPRPQPI